MTIQEYKKSVQNMEAVKVDRKMMVQERVMFGQFKHTGNIIRADTLLS